MPPVVEPSPSVPMVTAVSPTKLAETRYEVRGYRDAANPALRHEGHTVFRRTRVPVEDLRSVETVPFISYAPPSIAPLPASDELTAELATQRRITRDVRALQETLKETQIRMQAEYAALVRQSADTLKLREQLEAERKRFRATTPVQVSPAVQSSRLVLPSPTTTPEVKW